MPLTAQEDAVLSNIGSSFFHNFITETTMLMMFGINLVLFPYAFIVLWRKPSKSRATYTLLVLIAILFVSTTLEVASGLAISVAQFQKFLISPGDVPLLSRGRDFADLMLPFFLLSLVTQNITFIIADAIVMWRAWVLYSHSRFAQWVMAIFLFLNTGVFIAYAVSYCEDTSAQYRNIRFNVASTYLSATTNLLATILIGLRFWQFRRSTKALGARHARRSRTWKVMILLLETGFLFAVLQFTSAILSQFTGFIPGSPADQAQTALGSITSMAAAILPTLIIIIVGRNNTSVVDGTIVIGGGGGDGGKLPHYEKASTANRDGGPVSMLRFASVHTTTTTPTTADDGSPTEHDDSDGTGTRGSSDVTKREV